MYIDCLISLIGSMMYSRTDVMVQMLPAMDDGCDDICDDGYGDGSDGT